MSFGDGLASFGRGYSFVSAIIASFLSVILFGTGVWMLFQKKDDPANPYIKGNPKTGGAVLIGLSVLIVVISWGWVWLTRTSKFAAQAGGALGGFDIAQSIM